MKRLNKHNKNLPIIIGTIFICIILISSGIIYFYFFHNKHAEQDEQNVNEQKQNESEQNVNKQKQNESEQIGNENKKQQPYEKEINKIENQNHIVTKKEEESKPVIDNGYIVGESLPEKPTYIKGVLIVNKKYPLPKNYNPGENKEARESFNRMVNDAKKEGYLLTTYSSFRSYDLQKKLYDQYVKKHGINKADRFSARPGYSEHQTGLAFDIGEVGRKNLWLTEQFGESEAGKWLAENAHKYGFILRYPKGKEHITGYMYESWHFRYVGVKIATEIKQSGLTLEEYLGIHEQ